MVINQKHAIDKKVKEYLERAGNIILKEYSPISPKRFDTMSMEIAKMIQKEELFRFKYLEPRVISTPGEGREGEETSHIFLGKAKKGDSSLRCKQNGELVQTIDD